MDGLLVIDKPAGITSHDVVDGVRHILGTKRVGHTGTLDPFATGVMVILVGRATRLAQFLDKDQKEYEATIRFGFETDTGDATGTPKSQVQSPTSVSRDLVRAVLPQFVGEIEQLPPMYSAKKIGGKKLYESARKGIQIERVAHPVTIYSLEVIDIAQPIDNEVRIRVVCSAGTYIRALAEDIGHSIGVGAHLTELRRTRSGRFDLSQATTLEDLAHQDLVPMEQAVEHLPKFVLDEDRVQKTQNGLSTRIADGTFAEGQIVRISAPDGELIAMGVYSAEDTSIKPNVVLV